GYRKLLPLKDFKHFIKHSDSKTRNHFIGMAFNNKTDVFSRNFSNKMINIFPKNEFYIHIQQFPENDSPSYMLYNSDIKEFIQFMFVYRSVNNYFLIII